MRYPPPPPFLYVWQGKRLRFCGSPLFATHPGRRVSVAVAGLTSAIPELIFRRFRDYHTSLLCRRRALRCGATSAPSRRTAERLPPLSSNRNAEGYHRPLRCFCLAGLRHLGLMVLCAVSRHCAQEIAQSRILGMVGYVWLRAARWDGFGSSVRRPSPLIDDAGEAEGA
jgi:hypothetical protein